MKNKLTAAALLLALAVAGVGYTHGAVNATADRVEFTPATRLGDPEAVADLELAVESQEWGLASWDTRLALSGEQTTEFTYEPNSDRWEWHSPTPDPLEIRDYWLSGGVYYGGLELQEGLEAADQPALAMALDLARRSPEDGEFTETMRYLDYFDDLRAEVSMALPGREAADMRNLLYMGEDDPRLPDHQFLYELSRAFRFPAEDGDALTITVVKGKGNLRRMEVEDAGESRISIDSVSGLTANWLWFVVDASRWRQESGLYEPMDYSLTPGGYALYRLPLVDRPLTLEDLETVLVLEPGENVIRLEPDGDGSHLVLTSVREGQLRCRVLEETSGRVQYEYEAPQEPKGATSMYGAVCHEDQILFANNRQLVLLEEQGGEYRPVMTCGTPTVLDGWGERRAYGGVDLPAFRYDGDRLMVAMALGKKENFQDCADLALLVFRQGELLYAGELQSTLSRGGSGNDSVRITENSIRLNW